MRRTGTFIIVLLAIVQSVAAADSNGPRNITKCKDANGVWHYGDFAADHCAVDSDVTEINEHGVKVKVEEAVPDAHEIKQFSEISERKLQKQRSEQEARSRDLRLLAMYESIEDLVSDRDERVSYISEIIGANQEVLGSLHSQHSELSARYEENSSEQLKNDIETTEQSIELYERVIANRLREVKEVKMRYDADIQRYRRLLNSKKPDGTALTSE